MDSMERSESAEAKRVRLCALYEELWEYLKYGVRFDAGELCLVFGGGWCLRGIVIGAVAKVLVG
jgi:hypothetical protein